MMLCVAALAEDCNPNWVATFGGEPGMNGSVYCFATFDDGSGSGPALYVGGAFTTAGGKTINRIAKWDGQHWFPLGQGMTGAVHALAVFDDGFGGGPALYAGGDFPSVNGVSNTARIAKWNGQTWSALGTGMNSNVEALAVFDDGNGAALYAGGYFTVAGGIPANRIAKWNGTSWSALPSQVNDAVLTLKVFEDDSDVGPALYAGGLFTMAGAQIVNHVGRWNGTAWTPLSTGTNDVIYTLETFKDRTGGGTQLYAGGIFTTAGKSAANRIAKWNGTNWVSLGSGLTGAPSGTPSTALSMSVFDDGSGDALYVGGTFYQAGGSGSQYFAKWDGSAWTQFNLLLGDRVFAMMPFDNGSGEGERLFVGGQFSTVGTLTALRIASWGGPSSGWSQVGGPAIDAQVAVLTTVNDWKGQGPTLFAGGNFTTVGEVAANRIAMWNDSGWTALGAGVNNNVVAIAEFDDGFGPALFVGGHFTSAGGVPANHIAKWNGTAWSSLGMGVPFIVRAMAVFDDGTGSGPALYVGGEYVTGDLQIKSRVMRWDGTNWSQIAADFLGYVFAMNVFDDASGEGESLYVGGAFTQIGGIAANHIAKWNGQSWMPLGIGTSGAVYAFAADVGPEKMPLLYVGGQFSSAGGMNVWRIAGWNGNTWSALGTGMDHEVRALTVFDDGSGGGSRLYAGGKFTNAGGAPVDRLAQWSGTSWSAFGNTMNSDVLALAGSMPNCGNAPALFVGGNFTASPAGDRYLARWQGCTAMTVPGDLDCDGVVGVPDLLAVINSWGPCLPLPTPCPADVAPPPTGDGTVGVPDLLLIINNWG